VTALSKLLLGICVCCGLVMPVRAQDEHEHIARQYPPQDQPLHEKFYSTGHMTDHPYVSCCNDADCYPTEIKYVDGNIYAKRRGDGKYIPIPPEKIERNRDNPDIICALRLRTPSTHPTPCSSFAQGGAT
jgi:hypothetical protein